MSKIKFTSLLRIILSKLINKSNNICYSFLNLSNRRLISINNARQIRPQRKRAFDTTSACARLPEIRLPKGVVPAKVIIKTLITLPRNLSGTLACNRVLTKARGTTLL